MKTDWRSVRPPWGRQWLRLRWPFNHSMTLSLLLEVAWLKQNQSVTLHFCCCCCVCVLTSVILPVFCAAFKKTFCYIWQASVEIPLLANWRDIYAAVRSEVIISIQICCYKVAVHRCSQPAFALRSTLFRSFPVRMVVRLFLSRGYTGDQQTKTPLSR